MEFSIFLPDLLSKTSYSLHLHREPVYAKLKHTQGFRLCQAIKKLSGLYLYVFVTLESIIKLKVSYATENFEKANIYYYILLENF